MQQSLVEAMRFDIEEGNFSDALLEKIIGFTLRSGYSIISLISHIVGLYHLHIVSILEDLVKFSAHGIVTSVTSQNVLITFTQLRNVPPSNFLSIRLYLSGTAQIAKYS